MLTVVKMMGSKLQRVLTTRIGRGGLNRNKGSRLFQQEVGTLNLAKDAIIFKIISITLSIFL